MTVSNLVRTAAINSLHLYFAPITGAYKGIRTEIKRTLQPPVSKPSPPATSSAAPVVLRIKLTKQSLGSLKGPTAREIELLLNSRPSRRQKVALGRQNRSPRKSAAPASAPSAGDALAQP